jgi:hypothetical protein
LRDCDHEAQIAVDEHGEGVFGALASETDEGGIVHVGERAGVLFVPRRQTLPLSRNFAFFT